MFEQLTKLKIYSGSNHPHSSQNPKLIDLKKLNNKNLTKIKKWKQRTNQKTPKIKRF